MSRPSSRDEVVNGILEGLKEAVAFKRGESKTARVTIIEVKSAIEVRKQLKLNRAEFAQLIGVSERTLEGWEQGRVKPTGAARSLLRVAAHNPSMLLEALR